MIDNDKERAHHQGGVKRIFYLFLIFPYHSFFGGINNKGNIVTDKMAPSVRFCVLKNNLKEA